MIEISKFAKHQQCKPVSAPLHGIHFNTDEHGHGSALGEQGKISWLVPQVPVIRETLVLQMLQDPPRKPP